MSQSLTLDWIIEKDAELASVSILWISFLEVIAPASVEFNNSGLSGSLKVLVFLVKHVEHLPYLQEIEISITIGIHMDISVTAGYRRMIGSVAPYFAAHQQRSPFQG